MDPDQDPWVPAPRDGDREGGVGCPRVPLPRVAPALERLPGRVATLAERPFGAPATATTLVPVPRRSTAVVVPDTGVAGLLRTWVRALARLAHVTVDGVRYLVDLVVTAPTSR